MGRVELMRAAANRPPGGLMASQADKALMRATATRRAAGA